MIVEAAEKTTDASNNAISGSVRNYEQIARFCAMTIPKRRFSNSTAISSTEQPRQQWFSPRPERRETVHQIRWIFQPSEHFAANSRSQNSSDDDRIAIRLSQNIPIAFSIPLV